MMLELVNIYKSYQGKPLLRGVSFRVERNETLCLLGPSGSGKSTLLRIIAGLEEPEGGSVYWDGSDLHGVPVHKRDFGLMFQDYALFPHRSVAENVAFGLRMKRIDRQEIANQVAKVLQQVGLEDFASRRVTDLSGGEQQRVALARAIVPHPRLLMLDEPLGSLDRALRADLLQLLRRLLSETGIPVIYVTHDQAEAFMLADRIMLLHNGVVEQDATPSEIFLRPASPWVATFLGMTNLISGKVETGDPLRVVTPLGVFSPGQSSGNVPVAGQEVQLLFRPVEFMPGEDGIRQVITGVVADVAYVGDRFEVWVNCGGQRLQFFTRTPIEPGATIRIHIPSEDILSFNGG